jgi:RNase P subunit RPR2
MREAYAVPAGLAVHFWTDIRRVQETASSAPWERHFTTSALWNRRRIAVDGTTRVDAERRLQKMTTESQTQWWVGFTCKQCTAPLAIQRSNDASKSAKQAARGWRVTCTSCGVTEYYEPGTPMLRMAVSN